MVSYKRDKLLRRMCILTVITLITSIVSIIVGIIQISESGGKFPYSAGGAIIGGVMVCTIHVRQSSDRSFKLFLELMDMHHKILWTSEQMSRCYNQNTCSVIWAISSENLFMLYANNKGADKPAHLHNLISAFVVHIIPLVSISEISSLELASVAGQVG